MLRAPCVTACLRFACAASVDRGARLKARRLYPARVSFFVSCIFGNPSDGGSFMHRLSAVAAVAVGVWLLVAGSAHAQQGTGELRGRVMDAQSAVLPGVTVVAKNEAQRPVPRSHQRRRWLVLHERVDARQLRADRAVVRLQDVSTRGRPRGGRQDAVDRRAAARSAASSEEVTVTAESPIVDTTSKQLGGSVPAQELNEMPSLNRNFTSYLACCPGSPPRSRPTRSAPIRSASTARRRRTRTTCWTAPATTTISTTATAARRRGRRSKRSRSSSC